MNLRANEDCRWDLVALGEVMVRLDPGDRRIAATRTLGVCEGGGEYKCFYPRLAASAYSVPDEEVLLCEAVTLTALEGERVGLNNTSQPS